VLFVHVDICKFTNAISSCGIWGIQAEVDLMSKIRHPNLVALLGFSSDGPEHLLVYELMHNGSLHDQLHGMLN
jgi:serine/threonine protein kinase